MLMSTLAFEGRHFLVVLVRDQILPSECQAFVHADTTMRHQPDEGVEFGAFGADVGCRMVAVQSWVGDAVLAGDGERVQLVLREPVGMIVLDADFWKLRQVFQPAVPGGILQREPNQHHVVVHRFFCERTGRFPLAPRPKRFQLLPGNLAQPHIAEETFYAVPQRFVVADFHRVARAGFEQVVFVVVDESGVGTPKRGFGDRLTVVELVQQFREPAFGEHLGVCQGGRCAGFRQRLAGEPTAGKPVR